MYLALIPDAESLAALRRFVPTLTENAHLTVIHSGVVLRLLPYPAAWTGELTLNAVGVRLFGGRIKKPVLVLDDTDVRIYGIRKQAESILRAAGISWSTGWGFSPHVAIGPGLRSGPQPETIRFDRMVWR